MTTDTLKSSQLELRDNTEELQAMLNSIDRGFSVWDREQRLVLWNDDCLDFWYGFENLEVGLPMGDLLHHIAAKGGLGDGETSVLAERKLASIIASGPNSNERFVMLDGRTISLKRYPMSDGKHASVYSDISERVKVQKELEQTEQTLLAVIQDSPIAVGIADKMGKFIFWNSLFYSMGRQVVNVEGRSEFSLSFEGSDTYQALQDRVEGGEAVINWEVELIASGDKKLWGLVSMHKMDFEGKSSILTWIYNITDLKTQEMALKEARIVAEEANLSKSDFLAQMIHEIRTPMNGVMSMADLLSLTPLTHEQAGMNKVISESSRTLLAIINDILDFSKIEAGKVDIEESSLSMTALVEGVVELLAPMAFDKGLNLIVFVDPQIPDHLLGDPVRLRQVLTNLLSNAIKFTETGEVVVKVVFLNSDDNRAEIRFSVADTGIGLTEDQMTILFQPFQQADTTITRRFGGTGLGLSISRNLVNLMAGEIQIESEFESGSTFSFELSFPTLKEKRELMDYDLTGIHVLIVVSDLFMDSAINPYLEYLGARCNIVASYEDVFEIVRETNREKGGVDVIVNLDAPSDVFYTSFLNSNLVNATGDKIPLVWSGLHPAENQLAKKNDDENILTVTRPYKREIICQTIAKAVNRSPNNNEKNNYNRIDDGPINTIYSPPSIKEAHDAGVLILVAEDNPTNQTVIKLIMSKLGFAIELVEDGAEALKKLEEKPYGLLISDCHMPVLDGYQLATEIRQRELVSGERLPIIALTADALTGTDQRCFAAGMDACLTKPVDRNLLNHTICKWLPKVADLRIPADKALPPMETTPSEPDTSIPILDILYFKNLIGDSEELLVPLLTEYIDTTRPIIEQLIEALNTDDMATARKAAHACSGASKTAGAMQLAAISEAIEKAIVDGDLITAKNSSGSIEPAFTLVVEKVESL